MENEANGGSSWLPEALSGSWHLVGRAANEVKIPGHRMDLRFDLAAGQFRAAVLCRETGEEMLMIHGASFDGAVLRLQMVAPQGTAQAEMPLLVMRVDGMKLFGHWHRGGVPVGPQLKLVRSHGAS